MRFKKNKIPIKITFINKIVYKRSVLILRGNPKTVASLKLIEFALNITFIFNYYFIFTYFDRGVNLEFSSQKLFLSPTPYALFEVGIISFCFLINFST